MLINVGVINKAADTSATPWHSKSHGIRKNARLPFASTPHFSKRLCGGSSRRLCRPASLSFLDDFEIGSRIENGIADDRAPEREQRDRSWGPGPTTS